MCNSIKSMKYWMKIIPVIVWHIIYLVVCKYFDKFTRVYCDLVFYSVIAIYFLIWRDWRFADWSKAIKQGRSFWIPVLLTVLGMVLAFGAGFGITMLFPNIDDGMGVFGINNLPTLIAFAFVTVFLPPIAEEAFYRKAVIAFDSRFILIVSTVISIMLYASEHSTLPLGFLQACMWAVPYSLSYIKTKNVYVCMTAHFLCNLVINGMTVISSAIRLLGVA